MQTDRKYDMGIDLGTTNSAGAVLGDDGKPQIVKNNEAELTTPSVVCIMDDGEVIVGRVAKNAAPAYATTTIIEVKRQMGQMGADGKPVPCLVDKAGKLWVPEEVSALILKKIITETETLHGGKVGFVVVTVPAYFTEVERQATINAAKIAGISDVELVNEPTAAALYYGIVRGATGRHVYAVYDLGGGTFDVSIIEVDNGDVRTLATDGVRRLGGTDFDMRIIARLKREAQKEGIDLDKIEDPALLFEIKDRAEKLKHALTSMSKATMTVFIEGHQVKFEYSREDFESDTRDLLEQTGEKLKNVLAAKSLTAASIDGIVLVGGASKMPMVKRYLRDITGKDPLCDADPDLVVALGAALAAGKMALADGKAVYSLGGKELKHLPGGDFKNCAAHALGCAAFDSRANDKVFAGIIPKNESLPAVRSQRFGLRDAGQRAALVEVYQGQEGVDLKDCLHIDDVLLEDLPEGDTHSPRIEVTYEYSRSGTVKVTVKDHVSGKTKSADIAHTLGLDQAEVRQAAVEVGGR